MQLTEEQIEKFRNIYQQRFKREISRERAIQSGMGLVRLFQMIYEQKNEDEDKNEQRRPRKSLRRIRE